MKLQTIIISLLFICFLSKSSRAQEPNSNFIFGLEVEDNELQMSSIKGTFWNELTSYNLLSKTYYISEKGVSGKKTDLEEADFLIKVKLKDEEVILEGIAGTEWDEYNFICPSNECKFTISNVGVKESISEQIENFTSISEKINELEKKKEEIRKQEKEKLKTEIEKINQNKEFQQLSKNSIDSLKMELAEKTAKNIDNQIAILENSIDYLERNLEEIDALTQTSNNSKFSLSLGSWSLVEFSENNDATKSKTKCKKQTKWQPLTSDNNHLVKSYPRYADGFLVLAVAFNNALPDGGSLNDTGIRFGGSRTFEIGYARDFRVFEKTNWLRIKYGISFQFNGLKPEGNRVFVKDGNQTNIEEFDFNLRKNKFRMDNLIIPVHLQLGRSKANINEETGRVSFKEHNFKIGIGGFVGLNLLNIQNLRYTNDLGIRVRERQRDDFNTNNFLYGLSAYVGWGSFSVFAQYNLNPIFRNNPIDTNNFQIGIRVDLN